MLKSSCVVTCMLLLMASNASAEQRFADWAVDSGTDSFFALTINDSGGVLGQWCFPESGSCIYLIGIKTKCEEKGKYPILANTDTGVVPLTIECRGPIHGYNQDYYRYVFTDFDRIDNLVKTATRVGFALPMMGDNFKIIRFDLTGAKAAVKSMRETAASASKQVPKPQPARGGTRDQTL